MFTLPIFTEPRYSPASSSTIGAIMRHGPHQGAQKSTSTGSLDWTTSVWKLPSLNLGHVRHGSLLGKCEPARPETARQSWGPQTVEL